MSDPKQDGGTAKFIFEKTPAFVTHFADGTWAMGNYNGHIQLNFYIERPQLPTAVTFQLDEKGAAKSNIPAAFEGVDSENRHVVREFQSAVVLTLPAARQLATVLGNFIGMAEIIQSERPNE